MDEPRNRLQGNKWYHKLQPMIGFLMMYQNKEVFEAPAMTLGTRYTAQKKKNEWGKN